MSNIGKTLTTAAVGGVMVVGLYALIALNGQSSVATPADFAAAQKLQPKVSSAPSPKPPSASTAAAAAAKPVAPPANKVVAATSNTVAIPVSATAGSAPDAEAGKAVFAKCKACHTAAADGKNGVGPTLYGVVNRPVAVVAGFAYSDAMKAKAGETWSPQALFVYLKDPKASVKGTKMAFAGLPSDADRVNVIAYLAQNSATPVAPADLGLKAASAAAPAAVEANAAAPAAAAAATTAQAPAAEAAAPEAPAVVYTDPPPPSDAEIAKENASVAALMQTLPQIDYQRARYSPIHFKPLIDTATNGECLACHKEVLETTVRDAAPNGVKAADSLAWYQTLATYQGEQATFHQRHMTTPYAKEVMDLKCTFCHQGNDPREESPHATVAPADMTANNGKVPFTNRKMVNVSETCLRCHGAMPDPVNIMGLPGPWPQARVDLENADTPNGCLTCHEQLFRTNRHNVTYLKAKSIEDIAKMTSDTCYGCHGGRAWYKISYPYPRHSWPGMDASTVPEWAKNRPTESDPRYARNSAAK